METGRSKMSAETLSFLSAANPEYIADLYAKYQQSPGSVDNSWATLFSSLDDDGKTIIAELKGASWRPSAAKIAAVLSSTANEEKAAPAVKKDAGKAAPAASAASVTDSLKAFQLIRSYQTLGHLLCDLDPLGLAKKQYHPDLDPKSYGFSEADYDRPIALGKLALGLESATLRQILAQLQETYCGHIGVEYMHIQDTAQREWMRQRIESTRNKPSFSPEIKKELLQELVRADGFELFAQTKYTSVKRFGAEGGETIVPAIESIITRAAELGVTEVAIGMAHRGRLNILTNVLGQSFTYLFSIFQGAPSKPEEVHGSGDVKYHLGVSNDREFGGRKVHVSMAPNPSHLEFVDPVVAGKIRAKQDMTGDTDRSKAMALLIHGDAALAGQGVVPELLMMSELPGYRVGGSMHVVINNQIGFTTGPAFARSGNYCTDVATVIQAPVFHVNGDDVEAVILVCRLAADFRQEFKKDVFVDIVCYRRRGHNESDEPAFTQPKMYKIISEKPTVREIYAQQLIREGIITADEASALSKAYHSRLEKDYEAAKNYKSNQVDMLEGKWDGLKVASGDERRGDTAITPDLAQKIGKAITSYPADFDLNPKIARQLDAKKKMFETGEGFDWATAEALAFGALTVEGFNVRLSGQDCGRGTFSHRHALLTDQTNEKRYFPLQHVDAKQARFEVHNSPLSEAGVMGFEYGYSVADPRTLVLWEGQFGDFYNGAQVFIDQFISSAETKWLRMSGLTLLLPHGLEGQGPEHSSARLERFLQMSAEDNWQVANCSTPANYFHILRRQMKREFRKPLILMTPKSLLRHKLCVSHLRDFTGKESFHRTLSDTTKVTDVKRVLLCSGKVYYDLYEAREKAAISNIAIVRLEQFYPFPDKSLADQLRKYPDAEIVWCQEEHENHGAWTFVDRRIEKVLAAIKHKSTRVSYIGRPEAAAPATGTLRVHIAEQEKVITQALTL
jgi:2-oxoglutarate dehydrogenase E1 component